MGEQWKKKFFFLEDFALNDLRIKTHYFKNKIAPNLKIKYRSDVDPEKYKMTNVSDEQLKNNNEDVTGQTLDNVLFSMYLFVLGTCFCSLTTYPEES